MKLVLRNAGLCLSGRLAQRQVLIGDNDDHIHSANPARL